MKIFYQLILSGFLLLCCNIPSGAQLSSGNLFLQGRYLEIGQNSYGAFGTAPTPSGYHPYGYDLAEVYDYGHDGWYTGYPPYMGDYTYPGSPFEGWGIQVGSSSQLNWAFTSTGYITGTGSLSGSNVSYTNAGGHAYGNWHGTCGPGSVLTIDQETRVDTNASWVVMTTKMHNTGSTALNNIYYMRTCDPDNDEAHGGSFSTYNKVVYQNDAVHRVMVKATGETYTYAYLGLCTKDQRAKALVYSYWPINYYCSDLSGVYSGSAGIYPDYTVGLADDGDIATGVVFYICSIPAGDSAVVSCAYTFLNSDHGVDSAFPDPCMVLDSVLTIPSTVGGAIYDTFYSCSHPGMTTVPVSLTGATTGVWTWSTWTWSPGVGLSASTGTSVTVSISALPGQTTYTITGNDSLPGSTCAPGNRRTMYLTIVTCFGASADTPCLGGSLHLNAIGDSTGATYQWFNPAGTSAGTLHHLIVSPVVWADTGTWRVVRTIGSTTDTARVHVTIHGLPSFTVSDNADSICSTTGGTPLSDTLKLYCLPYIIGEHFAWTGPSGFTSSLEDPFRTPYIDAYSGTYSVTVTSAFGCSNSSTITIVPCFGATCNSPCIGSALYLYASGDSIGATYKWLNPGGALVSTLQNVTIAPCVWADTGTWTVIRTLGVFIDTLTTHVTIHPLPIVTVTSNSDSICSSTGGTPLSNTLSLYSLPYVAGEHYAWTGPGGFTSTASHPFRTPYINADAGTYYVTVTDMFGCIDTGSITIIPCFAASCTSPCFHSVLHLYSYGDSLGATYQWISPGGTIVGTSQNLTIPISAWSDTGTWTVIRSLGGFTNTVTTHVTIHPLPAFALSCNGDSLCSSTSVALADTMKLYCYPFVSGYTYLWTGPGGFTSTAEYPFITPYQPVDTGWYKVVVTDILGCEDSSDVFARIIPPIIPPTITGVHHYCTGETFVPFGISLISGASALWYTDSVGGYGSSTAPYVDISYAHIVTVYASQYQGFCEGLRSSFTVVIDQTPDPSVLSSNTPICADSTLTLTATNTLGGGSFSWSGPAGFSYMLQNPVINNAQVTNSGTYTLVYTMPTTCHSTASTVVVINPTPAPPVLTANTPCDSFTLTLTAIGTAGSNFTWSGPGGFTFLGTDTSITPARLGTNNGAYTVVASLPGVGISCSSLPVSITAKIWPNPKPPKTHDTAYCQGNLTPASLWADSLSDSAVSGYYNFLTWYNSLSMATQLNAPVYPQTSIVVPNTWFVMQTTVHGTTSCVSHLASETVNILDLPVFKIWQSSMFACQDSSLTVRYQGLTYTNPEYAWGLPNGASIIEADVSSTPGEGDSTGVRIRFDSLFNNTVTLLVTDSNWNITCQSASSVTIKVEPMPIAHEYINTLVCAGDTVNVELTDRSNNSFSFIWDFDFHGNDGIISSTSGSTGPFGVRWVEGGTRIVKVIPVTEDGCTGLPFNDTILVRERPDATFNHGQGATVCARDSVLFAADLGDSSNYTYNWQPEHFFNENNHGNIWGRVEVSGYITLTITNQYGCIGQDSLLFETNPACCTVSFPTAFTPNGDGKNDLFRPIYTGYHTFHIFRIQNRWGQRVFESTGSDNAWDGNFNGIPQDVDVYYYYLKFDCNGQTIEKRGDVTLIR